jgi:hypothetical protein
MIIKKNLKFAISRIKIEQDQLPPRRDRHI